MNAFLWFLPLETNGRLAGLLVIQVSSAFLSTCLHYARHAHSECTILRECPGEPCVCDVSPASQYIHPYDAQHAHSENRVRLSCLAVLEDLDEFLVLPDILLSYALCPRTVSTLRESPPTACKNLHVSRFVSFLLHLQKISPRCTRLRHAHSLHSDGNPVNALASSLCSCLHSFLVPLDSGRPVHVHQNEFQSPMHTYSHSVDNELKMPALSLG